MTRLLILAALVGPPLSAPLAAQAETPRSTRIEVSAAGLDLTNLIDAADRRSIAACMSKIMREALKNASAREPQLNFQPSAPIQLLAQG